MRHLRGIALLVLGLGCGKSDKPAPTAGSATTEPSQTAKPAERSDTATAPAPDVPQASEPPIESLAPGSFPDLCKVAKRADIEAAIGPLSGDPKVTASGCQMAVANRVVSIDARAPAMFEAGVKLKGNVALKIGEQSFANGKTGVMVKLAGKPYALQVSALVGKDHDNETAEALAKVVVAALK